MITTLAFMDHLIPFKQIAESGTVGIIGLFVIMIVSLAVIGKGADWLVEGTAQLAYRLGIPKIVVGATVVSLGTTSPEAAVSVMSAVKGESGLALGNAIGSVICDTGLIFGLCCLITKLPIDRFILNRQGWVQFGSGVLLLGIIYGLNIMQEQPMINRWIGFGLLGLLVWYLYISVRWARQHPTPSEHEQEASKSVGFCFFIIVVGLVCVIASAEALIGSATEVCRYFDIPEEVIAATVIAFGTSLPELVTALVSIKKGHPEILIGNIVGADILNILFVTGAAAAATPLAIPDIVLKIHLPAMMLILLIFRIFIAMNKTHFQRWCGVPLLLIYIGFIILSYTYS